MAPASFAGFAHDSSGLPVKPGGEGRGEGSTAPFRSLGVVADAIRRPDRGTARGAARGAADLRPVEPGQGSAASPSGLLTRRAWEAELTDFYGEMPGWYESGSERDRRFAHWVQAEAKGLAMRLERLLGTDTEPALARQTLAIAEALWADADWARRRIDGSLDD